MSEELELITGIISGTALGLATASLFIGIYNLFK